MTESRLEKIVRLAAVPVRTYQRQTSRGVTNVHSYQQMRRSGMRLGTPYRSAWGNISVGDVVEFGSELWQVIPASSFPGYKPPTSTGTSTSKGTGAATGGSTTGVTTGKSTSSGTGAASGGSTTGSGGVATSTSYLEDLKSPGTFDKLTLPSNYIVTIVPVLP